MTDLFLKFKLKMCEQILLLCNVQKLCMKIFVFRSKETVEQTKRRKLQDAQAHSIIRSNESQEEHNARLEKDRLSKASARRNQSPETKKRTRAAATAGEADRREAMSPNSKKIMLQSQSKSMRKGRGTE